MNQLQENGWTIVPNVMSSEEIQTARNLFWNWLEGLNSGIDRSNIETWKNSSWPGSSFGLLSSHQISQSEFAWYVRSRPLIKEVFSQIWKTDDLACSMDAIICWRPWWLNRSWDNWKPKVEGYHLDQNPNSKPGFHCVQGMVPLYDVTENIGGLALAPKTHTPEIQEQIREHLPMRNDWCVLPDQEDPILKDIQLINAKAGDLILWDSRLIHGGQIGSGQGKNEELARLSVPVCMMPRKSIPEEIKKEREEAFINGNTLSHWVNECNYFPSFAEEGYGTKIPLSESNSNIRNKKILSSKHIKDIF